MTVIAPQVLSANATQRIAIPISAAGEMCMVSVSIKTGFGVISFRDDSDLAKVVAANGGTSRHTIPLFEAYRDQSEAQQDELSGLAPQTKKPGRKKSSMISIVNSGLVLSGMLDRLQTDCKMLCAGNERWWYFPNEKWELFVQGLAEMQAKLKDELLPELQKYYEGARSLFAMRLTNILTSADRVEEFPKYYGKFPTWREIESQFRIDIEGPFKIPSAMDLMRETNPQFKAWMGQIHEQISRDVPKITDEIFDAIADFCDRMESYDPANLKTTQAEMLARGCERVVSLRSMYKSMQQVQLDSDPVDQVAERTLQLAQQFSQSTKDVMFTALQEFKTQLRQVDAIVTSGGKGAKALARFAGIVTIEDRVKKLMADISVFKKLPENEQAELAPELRDRVRSMVDILGIASSALLQSIGMPAVEVVPEEAPVQLQVEESVEAPVDADVAEAGF